MPPSSPRSVFISYSHKDAEAMHRVVAFLREKGIQVWVDEVLRGGDAWRREIEQAIHHADYVIPLISPNANDSPWVAREIAYGQSLEKPFLPVMVAQTILPLALAELHYIDMCGLDVDDALRQLLRALRDPQHAGGVTDPEVTPGTVPTYDHENPLPNWTSLLIRAHLENVTRSLRRTSRATWRASLLWFNGDRWYIAAENGAYSDEELRLWLRKGQGFAGRMWLANEDVPYKVYHTTGRTPAQLADDLNVPLDHAALITRMGTMICFPIFRRTSQGNVMCGALSIDKKSGTYDPGDATLMSIQMIAESLGRFVDYVPMPYKCTRALRDILRVARLIPPIEAPTRAGVFWLKPDTRELYLIAGSERNVTQYSTNAEILYLRDTRQADNLIWRAAAEQTRMAHTDPAKKESSLALPMLDPQTGNLMGIFHIACNSEHQAPDLQSHEAHLQMLASLAVKVLKSRNDIWNE